MYVLQIHTVDDFPNPFAATSSAAPGRKPSATNNNNNNNFADVTELKGVVHLFRNLSPATASLTSPSSRSTTLFVAAVPNYLSPEDFLLFCGSHLDHFSQLCFLRNDAMEDRYSVLITLVNQLTSDGFYCSFNGKRFRPSEVPGFLHLYVELLRSATYILLSRWCAISSKKRPVRLPTDSLNCQLVLFVLVSMYKLRDWTKIRVEYRVHCVTIHFNVLAFQSGRICLARAVFQVPHQIFLYAVRRNSLPCYDKKFHQVCRLCQQHDEKPRCAECGTLKNLWVCVICGFVGCGRYQEKHAVRHWEDTQHCFSLELKTQQVWDYVGDIYVHRLNQSKADGKSAMMNSRCMSIHEECGTCGCSEDSGISEALFDSKVEAIADEYNRLLATQMETQRQNFESQLIEVKCKKESSIAEAVEKALSSRMQDIQSKLEQYVDEKKTVADTNQCLMKRQEILRKAVKEIEDRENSSLMSRNETIRDLEEQIRDLKVYIEAQRTVATMNGIKGGTLLPVQSNLPSPANSKRRTKTIRRRS
ncbi:hypothetical protein RHGRI_009110 [Rhododendron griersonianum]|uniref:UBP-type domain-containing protein n=1 Tax=Rhododendron griersonianum TaxID=479676 RepID=A0AAV6L476_9ERIC|nr:hypothetical protein RHGRI_009110 [Rhododendron griersonianum]